MYIVIRANMLCCVLCCLVWARTSDEDGRDPITFAIGTRLVEFVSARRSGVGEREDRLSESRERGGYLSVYVTIVCSLEKRREWSKEGEKKRECRQ